MAKTTLERGYMLYSDIQWECDHENKVISRLKISTKDGSSLYKSPIYLSDHDYLTVLPMCEQCFKKKRLLLSLGGRKLEWLDR